MAKIIILILFIQSINYAMRPQTDIAAPGMDLSIRCDFCWPESLIREAMLRRDKSGRCL